MKLLLIVIGMLAGLSSCTNSIKNVKEDPVDSSAVFYDYNVRGEEGDDSVTVLLQYRIGNYEGSPMALDDRNKVTLDGTEIKADSARLTGVFYEIMLPIEEFKGTHTVVFTGKHGKEYRQEFNFLPFALAAELPAQVKKESFTIHLSEFEKQRAPVRLVIIDTAFDSPDVNEVVMIRNGELTITEKMWRALKPGPVVLEIYREQETPILKGSKEEGRLTMTYGLKREFDLIDN